MKAKEVMETLRISRSTLYNLRKQKALDHHVLPNGHYEYDEESVYKYLLRTLGKSPQRKTVIYARVSTKKQKVDLENQLKLLTQFCISNGWQIGNVYKDIAPALNFDQRNDFDALMKEITEYRIGRVVITFKDRLTRTGYRFFENLFKKYGVSIVVVNDFTQEKSEVDELMEEIFALLHGFSMEFYSSRRRLKNKLKDAITGEDR